MDDGATTAFNTTFIQHANSDNNKKLPQKAKIRRFDTTTTASILRATYLEQAILRGT